MVWLWLINSLLLVVVLLAVFGVRARLRHYKHHFDREIELWGSAIMADLSKITAAVGRVEASVGELVDTTKEIAALLRNAGGDQGAVDALAGRLDAAADKAAAEVAADDPTPPFAVVPLANGKVGEAYAASIDVPDPSAVSCIIQSGKLPDGLSLVGEDISGTPTAAGDFNVVVWHIDAQSLHVGPQVKYTISVSA